MRRPEYIREHKKLLKKLNEDWANACDGNDYPFLKRVKFVDAYTETEDGYRISEQTITHPPTVWTAKVSFYKHPFSMSMGEHWEPGFGGWNTSPWVCDGEYSMNDYRGKPFCEQAWLGDQMPNKVAQWLEQFSRDWPRGDKQDPFNEVAQEYGLEEWVREIADLKNSFRRNEKAREIKRAFKGISEVQVRDSGYDLIFRNGTMLSVSSPVHISRRVEVPDGEG